MFKRHPTRKADDWTASGRAPRSKLLLRARPRPRLSQLLAMRWVNQQVRILFSCQLKPFLCNCEKSPLSHEFLFLKLLQKPSSSERIDAMPQKRKIAMKWCSKNRPDFHVDSYRHNCVPNRCALYPSLSEEGVQQVSSSMSTNNSKIGNFIVKELIGQGSFSEVYSCVLPDCANSTFAIKRLLSTCSSKKILNEVVSLFLLKVGLVDAFERRIVQTRFLSWVLFWKRRAWTWSSHPSNPMTLHCSFVTARLRMSV